MIDAEIRELLSEIQDKRGASRRWKYSSVAENNEYDEEIMTGIEAIKHYTMIS